MNRPLKTPPVIDAFPPHVMEPLHAELAFTYLGAPMEMAGSMIDLAAEHGSAADEAHDKAAAAVRRSLADALLERLIQEAQ